MSHSSSRLAEDFPISLPCLRLAETGNRTWEINTKNCKDVEKGLVRDIDHYDSLYMYVHSQNYPLLIL